MEAPSSLRTLVNQYRIKKGEDLWLVSKDGDVLVTMRAWCDLVMDSPRVVPDEMEGNGIFYFDFPVKDEVGGSIQPDSANLFGATLLLQSKKGRKLATIPVVKTMRPPQLWVRVRVAPALIEGPSALNPFGPVSSIVPPTIPPRW